MTKKEVKSTLKEKFLPVDFGLQGSVFRVSLISISGFHVLVTC